MILHDTTVERTLKNRVAPIEMITKMMRTQYIEEWSHIAPSSEEIRDMFSDGQMASKFWLADALITVSEECNTRLQDIIIVGSWYGTLSWIIKHVGDYEGYTDLRMTLMDLDPRCEDMIQHGELCDEDYVRPITNNMHFFQNYHSYDTIINTACEHINLKEWLKVVPPLATLVLQSNNMFDHPQHISCVNSVEELAEQADLSVVYFQGTLKAATFERYMVIGYK